MKHLGLPLFSAITYYTSVAIASFPGSTFGIVYNTQRPHNQIPAFGHLSTFRDSSASTESLTTISDGVPDLGAFFTISGVGAALNDACSGVGIATLAPLDPPIDGLDYALQWTTQPLSNLPPGVITRGFSLGPSPAFDELQNSIIGERTWMLVQRHDRKYIVGWASKVENGIPVILNKIAPTSVTCPTSVFQM